ncbi:hypothetical protein L208DRAFT_1279190 [Tricholoma matsutake]|nr:hypothetical protein L208DRAFT_1279190 [Tricholoma matsutake 945]
MSNAISDLYINIPHSVSQARIVKVYSFDTSTCYTYYESIRWCPPNPYHSVHCMHLIDCIIQYIVAYLSVPIARPCSFLCTSIPRPLA